MRNRTLIAAVVAVAVLIGAAVVGVLQAFDHDLPLSLPRSPSCVVSADPAPSGSPTVRPSDGTGQAVTEVVLIPSRMANAATIAAVGIRRGVPQRAVVVALATALQESKLDNLAGGDRDSIGLFQQRPSQGWGTAEQIADPRYAANAFYAALLKVRGWQQMRITDAAQAVQRSAYPEAYQSWATDAEVLASALTGNASMAVACTLASGSKTAGELAATNLAAGLRLDWGEVRTANTADPLSVTVSVGDNRAGWRYAHWLVAHAEGHGIKRVRFGTQEWTARKGTWQKVAADRTSGGGHSAGAGRSAGPSSAAGAVLAEVYPG